MYKINIWRYRRIVDKFESDNLEDLQEWYNENWMWDYEYGECAIDLFYLGKSLSWEDKKEIGFKSFPD